jgi:hypothetical protein
MLEEIKATLVRKGIFEADKDREQTFEESKENQARSNRAEFKENSPRLNMLLRQYVGNNETANSSTRNLSEEGIKFPDDQEESGKKSFIIRFFLKFVYSLDLRVFQGCMKFFVLKDENFNVSATNIKEFFNDKIDNDEF